MGRDPSRKRTQGQTPPPRGRGNPMLREGGAAWPGHARLFDERPTSASAPRRARRRGVSLAASRVDLALMRDCSPARKVASLL